ncbi:hypothetical protein MROS_2732 [Melioribacter roseus P3M-2]|uniref:Gas vesicle protein n=1 Tax=Melioribacter roseus (strain DSM 23840 / JCM 17771 / VKM B-2668 / P3M-2) TaxID=1191523 RepID=I6YZI0_MELRP|nr:YtxH domain-containing protein [Melioribacter roseus]AFN75962.1 hypothetical protein MROS_2732 [Melioribacter roseus P3M-2]
MHNDETRGVGKGILIGFFAGAAVGSLLGLLFAPKSGKELREDIRVKSKDVMDDAESYLAVAKDKANQLINEGKKKSEKLVAETKEKVDALLDEAEKVLSEAKVKASEAVKTGKEKVEKESDKLKTAVKAGVDAYRSEKES